MDRMSDVSMKGLNTVSKGDNQVTSEENDDKRQSPSDIETMPKEKELTDDTNQDSDDSHLSKSSGNHHLSPEEKDRYAFISEQLSILNRNNTGSPPTAGKKDKGKKPGSSKSLLSKAFSPFKKLIGKGIKRSRRKSPTRSVKKLKLQFKDNSEKLDRPLKQSDFEKSSSEDESSSDGGKWRIFEESSEDEIDRNLEDKADSLNLSALNVKSIIHKIVTDEHVLKMIQNSVESGDVGENESATKEDDGSLTFEPKMTRSKVKDFLQKQGSVPHPWGLSPVKHGSPSFVDIDLPEDEEEEDEDFDPEKVPVVESDEDSESVMSSNVSDIGSPMPSTPRTSCLTPSLSQRYTDTEDSQSLLSPMGPPTQLPRSTHKGLLGHKYQDAVAAEEARTKQEEEELIALRTRSKCPMTDLSILELEANFVAPDITEDMYETKCDDSEWETFLTSLTKVDTVPDESEDPVKDKEEGEEDDPEYNYLEEAEQYEQYDKEDFRDDRAVKVSKKELHMLMDELYEAYGDMDPIDMECKTAIKAQSRQIVQASAKKIQQQSSSMWRITENERKQLDEHMRKHVQLLTQLYILCQGSQDEHRSAGESAKMLLNELHTFATRQEAAYVGKPTALRACTLDLAYAIVNDPEILKEKELAETPLSKEGSRKPVFKFESLTLPPLSFPQMNLLWTSPVCMYPQLLPHGGMFKTSEIKKDRSRVKFLECEDNLLALGLEQFKSFPNGREIIQQLLLPTKTKKQISIRVKNLSARATKDNAVKYYRTHKQLPPFPRHIPSFDFSMMKAAKDQCLSAEVVPNWCKVFLSPSKDEESTCCSNSDCIKRRSGSLSSMSGAAQTGSTPSTPVNAGSDNTPTGSSGSSGKSLSELTLTKRPCRRRLCSLKPSPTKKRGSFVPLKTTSFPNTNITEGRISPITVYVVDKMPITSVGAALSSPVSMTTALTTTPVVTCVTPTIVVVNPSIAYSATSFITTNSSAQRGIMSASTSTHNLSSQRDEFSKISKSNEIPTISTPDLQRENVDKTSINANDIDVNLEDSDKNSEGKNNKSEKLGSRSSPDLVRDMKSPQASESKIVETSAEKGTISSVATQPNATENSQTNQIQPTVTVITDLLKPNETISRAETPTNDQNLTVIHNQCTPILIQKGTLEVSPATSNKSNNATPSSKSAIEIMASFAPYFISPSTVTNLEPRCQCTSDRKYRPVFPKFSTTTSASAVSPFLEKLKSSPRKRQLQQKARSILPKGFVINTYTSPSKKMASSLVDKAKGVKSPRGKSKRLFSPQKGIGLRKILPNPVIPSKAVANISQKISELNKTVRHETEDDIYSPKDTTSEYDTQESEFMSDDMLESNDNDEDFETTEDNEKENVNNNAQDEKSVDTESDYTQSEDGNETQDEGDSQEETMDVDDDDEHMANLMEASTTLRYKPAKVTGGLASLKSKRPRNKDVTLALLAPDIIESDPYRDDRDTAFAQAYLLKVKRVLRDDLDRYDKFLRLMNDFNKSGQSPVKLYADLRDLFNSCCPDLLNDFAGFLLPEQAVECDCFLSHQEFVRARTFLRKLEIYFSKTPSQFQKIMRAFTRWYKKQSRDLEDLRSQVEPMLRGQRHLLEEFSLFFPNDKPPESTADDFEEIDFDKSDDESKLDGFEEVELPEERDPQGTKRCQCQCHSTGDDTYRKRKKHCLSCCLTVIDGELVYRINSKTIKKINVKLGPTIKPRPTETKETTDLTVSRNISQAEGFLGQQNEDLSDTEVEEKENIEHFDESSQKAEAARARVAHKLHMVNKTKSPKTQGAKDVPHLKRSSFHQRVSSWSRKAKYKNKGLKLLSGSDAKPPSEQNSDESVKSQESVIELDRQEIDPIDAVEGTPKELVEETSQAIGVEIVEGSGSSSNLGVKSSESLGNLSEMVGFEIPLNIPLDIETPKQPNNELGREIRDQKLLKDIASSVKNPIFSSSDSIMASDILARAFNSAILGDVSMDSTSLPFGASNKFPTKVANGSSHNVIQEPKPNSSSSSQSATFGGGPEGQVNFTVSSDSSFSKIKKSGSSGFLTDENPVGQQRDSENVYADEKDAGNEAVAAKTEYNDKTNNMQSMSPKDIIETSVASPFSPFSPFAQEVQNITSAKSPFACIKSPNTANKKQTTPKLRRITPIRVKGSQMTEDESSSAFQAVAQNSPLIEDLQRKSPFDKSNLERHSSTESLNKTPVSSNLAKDIVFPSNIKEITEMLVQPVLRDISSPASASNSQKSMGAVSSQTSVESVISESHKSGSSAESKSQRSEVESQKSESGSQKSDSSEQRTSPVVISQPEMFSEDANEGFIKPVLNESSIVHSGILSENSLLGLVKVSTLVSENLHTISNLTNILSALEKTVHQPLSEQNKVETKEQVQTHPVDSESKQSAGTYIPQSTSSIENLERLKHLDIKVSRLSDSDESCSKFAPEISQGPKFEASKSLVKQDVENKTVTDLTIDSSTANSSQLDFSTFPEKDGESPEKIPKRFSGDQFTYLDDTAIIQTQISDVTELTGDNVKENDKSDSETQEISRKTRQTENTIKETKITKKKANAKTKRSANVKKSPLKSPRQTSNLSKSSVKMHKIKPKISFHEMGEDIDMNTIKTDTESHISHVKTSTGATREHSKIDTRRKQLTKDRDKTRAHISPARKHVLKKEIKSSKTAVKDSKKQTSAKSIDKLESKTDTTIKTGSSDTECVEKGLPAVDGDDLLPTASTSKTGGELSQDTSGSSVDDSSTEATDDDTAWTKDMDEIILVGCKLHGPKDRTFTKIAKQIGGVTPKQVQKRFHRLLTLLLESGSEDEG